ncbi:BQ2448_5115 [Microbotryum intermedium]|uniref:BQ2448_5115 protein n=1 Tax=Microbotryum intermedium TaxID=269621 RepID=A0A238F6M2_9BASI|nr:BQ2448_5115 [Microbotryum intermedium]
MANPQERSCKSSDSDSATTAPLPYRPPASHTLPVLQSLIRGTSFLICPPYPYTEEQATEWIEMNTKNYERIVGRWIEKGVIERDEEGCPVGNGRLGEGAGGPWVGDLGIVRKGVIGKEGGSGENEEGDEEEDEEEDTVWSYGFFLDPQYHRQGIMGATLKCVIQCYLLPILKAKHIRSCAFEDNWGHARRKRSAG